MGLVMKCPLCPCILTVWGTALDDKHRFMPIFNHFGRKHGDSNPEDHQPFVVYNHHDGLQTTETLEDDYYVVGPNADFEET
jgi:hypothetical protein